MHPQKVVRDFRAALASHWLKIATVGLCVVAFVLRWPHPQFQWQHLDERAFVIVPLGYWSGDLNPHFFNYPTFHAGHPDRGGGARPRRHWKRAGQRVRRRLVDPAEGLRAGPLCFAARGFSLHAATLLAADHRSRLEQLCRYVMRPPLASGRLRRLNADTLTYNLKTPWADGTTHLVLSPVELIEKLAALVPPRGCI